jgi:aryl-alcohol dehydrogenase (NADP+)
MTYGDLNWRPWVLPEEQGRPFIKRALELGINFFDTADMYSLGVSEAIVGRAVREFAARDKVVIATKAYFPMSDDPNDRGLSRKHLMSAIDASLRRLGTDYVDLYQVHRWDPATPIEETLSALHDIVRAGKARYIGASSMLAWQFAKALYLADRHGWTRFVSMQNHYNLVYREEEREMMPLCREEGIGVIPWSPLARGFLAGNRRPADKGDTARAKADDFAHRLYYADSDFEIVDRVVALAAARDADRPRLAPAATRCRRTDRRRLEDVPARRRGRVPRRPPDRRRRAAARGALRAAHDQDVKCTTRLTPRGARRLGRRATRGAPAGSPPAGRRGA